MAAPRGRGRKAATPAPVAEKVVEEPKDPLDFTTLPLQALRKYRTYHNLSIPSPMTNDGNMVVHGGVGKHTITGRSSTRVPKDQVAAAVKSHFMEEGIRETETIVDFVYAIQNKDKVFKLQC